MPPVYTGISSITNLMLGGQDVCIDDVQDVNFNCDQLEKNTITLTGTFAFEQPSLYKKLPKIKKIITDQRKKIVIIIWDDGSKTKSETHEDDIYIEDFGIMMCIIKKTFGSYTNYKNFIEDKKVKKIKI